MEDERDYDYDDYDDTEQIFCIDCGKLVTPKVETENYGADADGNRGVLREEYLCPDCGGDDLTEEWTNCDNCSDPMETGDNFCVTCRAEMRTLLNKWVSTIKVLGYDTELIAELMEEWLTDGMYEGSE